MTQREEINTLTAWHPWLRPLARVLIGALACQALTPLSAVAQDKGSVPYNPVAQQQLRRWAAWLQNVESAKVARAEEAETVADRTGRHLARAQALVHELQGRGGLRLRQPVMAGRNMPQASALGQHLEAIATDSARAIAQFDTEGASLIARHAAPEILARHEQARSAAQQRSDELLGQIQAWRQAPGDASVGQLAGFFDRYPATRITRDPRPDTGAPPKQQLLPWRAPALTQRSPDALSAAAAPKVPVLKQLQQAEAPADANLGIHFTTPPDTGSAPVAADLATGDETQLSSALRAKAAELGNNPVAIHKWVYDSIEWVPTWGAVQSAQDTFDKKRGNAFDIASLQIALLRAAHIPARYQFGTIELPVDKVQNWIGGATRPEAALQLLNQGGIAARGIVRGGVIQAIRMEHVWVQAYVNWMPSRGARQGGGTVKPVIATPDGIAQHVNPDGSSNAWVPLDSSYKQYQYAQGLDLKGQVPLDVSAVLSAAQQGATVDAAQGWVQNLNQANLQAQLQAYQARVKRYIDEHSASGTPSLGEVIGKKILPVSTLPFLAGSPPYAVIAAGRPTPQIPAALQHQFNYRLYASVFDRASDSPLLAFTAPTHQLAGKRLTLSYVPATQADADLIASYLPKPHADGSPIQPGELPASLPGYLIRVKAQLSLEGQIVAQSGQAVALGTDLYGRGGFTEQGDLSRWDLNDDDSHVAGQATAIGISAGGISAAQLDTLKQRLQDTQAKLQNKALEGLTGEQIVGDLLTAVIWSWFAAAQSHNRLSQGAAGVIENPGLSYGLFHAVVQPQTSWGIVRKVTFPGVNLDMGHVRNLTWAKDDDRQKWVAYNRLRGQYLSGLEGAVPERFFNDPTLCNAVDTANPAAGLPVCPQGISAVKAIALAAGTGQKIYTVTQEVYGNNPGLAAKQCR